MTRHGKSRDQRGAVGVTTDGLGWRCFQCDTGGDALDLVSYSVAGARYRELDGRARDAVRAWWTAPPPTSSQSRRAPPSRLGRRVSVRRRVDELWRAAARVDDDDEVEAFLAGRGLDAATIADCDHARALHPGDALPRWARGPSGPWTSTGHRLIVPLFDARGAHRSVVARSVTLATPKSLSPARCSRSGLVMTDGLGRQVLKAGDVPVWWNRDVTLRIVVVEGEIDVLTVAVQPDAQGDLAHGLAVLGVVQGSWTAELSHRLPRTASVTIATDPDEAGDRYADTIARSLRARGVVEVSPPPRE